jgi:hypothetical protein
MSELKEEWLTKLQESYPQHYFHRDTGAYGLRHEMTDDTPWNMIIPTSHWTKYQWEVIKNTMPKARYDMAGHFSVNVHYPSWKCETCGLSKEHLPVGTYYREISEALHEALEAVHEAND